MHDAIEQKKAVLVELVSPAYFDQDHGQSSARSPLNNIGLIKYSQYSYRDGRESEGWV